MELFDREFQGRGGRRGRAAPHPDLGVDLRPYPSRHLWAGDPAPADHILLTNRCEMLAAKGGFKDGLDSAALRELLEAAVSVFRASGRRVGGGRRCWGGGCGRAGWLDMVGTATSPVGRLGAGWDHLRTAIDTDRIAGAGGRCRPVPSGCWARAGVGPLRQEGRPGKWSMMPPLVGVLRGGIGPVRREAGSGGANEATPPSLDAAERAGKRVLVSVGGSCPHIAEEAEAHDGDDRHDEEFHDRSLLGPGVVTVDDSHHPSAVTAAYT
jgi:hypothetical protein